MPSELRLARRREVFRLWFEFLKLAINSREPKIQMALRGSEPFYRPWQVTRASKFDEWWKGHSHLFEEKNRIRRLKPGEMPSSSSSLILEIPLTLAPTESIARIKSIVKDAYQVAVKPAGKHKTVASADYKLEDSAEPKLAALREMLSVYRDVYLLNRSLRGEKLLAIIHAYYKGRKNTRRATVPDSLRADPDGNKARALRNMRRYIGRADRILHNVASGKFPGNY